MISTVYWANPMLRFLTAFVLLFSCLTPVSAAERFVIKDIKIEGLQRTSAGTVFNYLPVKVGDTLDEKKSSEAIKTLFKTGLFSDIHLEQENNVLVVVVVERPAIADVIFIGNKELDTDDLKESLKSINFYKGQVFNKSLLDKVVLELQRQYFNLGYYAVEIKPTVTPQPRNRVNVQIEVVEGKIAKIHQINFVGNTVFDDATLLDEFELTSTAWYLLFSKRDQYSSEKLTADKERLRAFYSDQGYLNFNIDSIQVTISPDKQNIYITVNVTEGAQYTVSGVKLSGETIIDKAELEKLITVKTGQIFSQKEVTGSTEAIVDKIGDEGYAFAKVGAGSEVNEKDKTVALNFFVEPGKRIYIRRIDFKGNTRTADEVMRRELRQLEGAWASTEKIKRSRTRLERLGFFSSVQVEKVPVPDVHDQVDLLFTVDELPGGNLAAGIGYSQTQGMLLNFSITQENFLGTGRSLSAEFNNSDVDTIYQLSYTNPYFTQDGISQTAGITYRETNAAEANLSRYALDIISANLAYSIPINEYDNIRFGFEPEQTALKSTAISANEVFNFINTNGDTYTNYKFNTGWSHDTRDRAMFPTKGVVHTIGAEVAIPMSDLTFYKINYQQRWYIPVTKRYVMMFKGDVGYGDQYGDTEYPFFENYTAGGPRSIRGFKENTLGPDDSNGYAIGGNLKVLGTAELIFPPPFFEDVKSWRLGLFLDVGNVYGIREDFNAGDLRYSVGLSATWYSPIGGLTFSLGKALNAKDNDDTQMFQFTIGATF
jgi:outer membrane protein insertion porin family